MKALLKKDLDAEKANSNTFKNMANTDSLTGIRNKHAYSEAEALLNQRIRQNDIDKLGVVVCDINGLKLANDTLGHAAGDKLIKDACSLICEYFTHGAVYRIGGDEFVVLLKGHDYDCRLELLDTLRGNMLRNKDEGKVTVAFGISDFDRSVDMRVQDVFERADAAMYKYKKSFKNQ